MSIPIYQVDAFVTGKKFSGNPAAVCMLERPADEQWMQNIAMEMNLSETAFLEKQADGYNLRWFTPAVEVALCGHATLASAHILWEAGHLNPEQQARFHTRSGVLTADRRGDMIELDFPARLAQPAPAPEELLRALGVSAKYVGKNQFDYLIEVDSAEVIRSVSPDMALLRKLPVRGVIVTAVSSNPEHDFVSRFFGPGSGVDEDPVTGSAHCALGPFWKTRLQKSEFVAYQASRRGGLLRVRVEGDRIKLAGKAETMFKGEIV
jgi:PhzF family phenazine biosynthesis protein